jgi:hypothetical protein
MQSIDFFFAAAAVVVVGVGIAMHYRQPARATLRSRTTSRTPTFTPLASTTPKAMMKVLLCEWLVLVRGAMSAVDFVRYCSKEI